MEIADTEIMTASRDMFARMKKVITWLILLNMAIRATVLRGLENESSISTEELFL